jgi:hypothetical protein
VADEKHEEKHDESFRVVDRRLFTAEGDLRQEVVEEKQREQQRTEKTAASTKANSTAASPQGAAVAKEAPKAASEAPSSAVAIEPSQSFQMLVDLLARNAAAYLGGIADPRTGQTFLDLEGAREMIDMLDALREKTRGNLAPEDDQLLLEVVGSLKLTFMEVSKAAAAGAKREKAKSGT